jgi:hypothetical protein
LCRCNSLITAANQFNILGYNFGCGTRLAFENQELSLSTALVAIKGRVCGCGAKLLNDPKNNVPSSIRLVHAAASCGNTKILALLNKYGCDMNARSSLRLRTPLLYAVQSRKVGVIDYFCSIGLDVNISPCNGNTPLHEAIKLRYVDVVYLLLSSKTVKVNQVNAKGESPLYCAARYELDEVLLSLLEAGADCNVQTWKGKTPLMVVLKYGVDYVKALIRKGANPNIKDHNGKTAVSKAVKMGMLFIFLLSVHHKTSSKLFVTYYL